MVGNSASRCSSAGYYDSGSDRGNNGGDRDGDFADDEGGGADDFDDDDEPRTPVRPAAAAHFAGDPWSAIPRRLGSPPAGSAFLPKRAVKWSSEDPGSVLKNKNFFFYNPPPQFSSLSRQQRKL